MIGIEYSKEARAVIEELKINEKKSKEARMLLKAIRRAVEIIKKKPHAGNSIKKKQIPKIYKEKYSVTNLYRIPLPIFWRMIYTINTSKEEVEIISFIIDIINHKEYNKKFRY